MPKGIPNKRYTGEFKEAVIKDMRENKLSQNEAAEHYEVPRSRRQSWERIYLDEGADGLYVERRGRASVASGAQKGRPIKLNKQIEGDLISEVQRLRAENDYLKNLQALVLKNERHRQKKRR